MNQDEIGVRRRAIRLCFPIALFIVLLIATPFTGWIFSVSADNVYTRGPLYFTQIIVSFFYLIYPSIIALNHAKKAKSASERMDCYTLAAFIVMPLLSGVIQALCFGLPTVSIMMVVSEL
ncbi:MAG: histidine kinase N-terminal 7TM domain-containing protein [Lachnospira sp.]|nr:histidine kinase N-terminal 7TM domain-containing protein [Lachnospira sp.]